MIKTMDFMGVPGSTYRVASTDAAQSIAAAVLEDAGRTMQGMILTVDTNSVRIIFGATPTQGTSGLGHTLTASALPAVFMGADLCEDLQFISAAASSAGGLQITPLYAV
jgi:hypothetical protein